MNQQNSLIQELDAWFKQDILPSLQKNESVDKLMNNEGSVSFSQSSEKSMNLKNQAQSKKNIQSSQFKNDKNNNGSTRKLLKTGSNSSGYDRKITPISKQSQIGVSQEEFASNAESFKRSTQTTRKQVQPSVNHYSYQRNQAYSVEKKQKGMILSSDKVKIKEQSSSAIEQSEMKQENQSQLSSPPKEINQNSRPNQLHDITKFVLAQGQSICLISDKCIQSHSLKQISKSSSLEKNDSSHLNLQQNCQDSLIEQSIYYYEQFQKLNNKGETNSRLEQDGNLNVLKNQSYSKFLDESLLQKMNVNDEQKQKQIQLMLIQNCGSQSIIDNNSNSSSANQDQIIQSLQVLKQLKIKQIPEPVNYRVNLNNERLQSHQLVQQLQRQLYQQRQQVQQLLRQQRQQLGEQLLRQQFQRQKLEEQLQLQQRQQLQQLQQLQHQQLEEQLQLQQSQQRQQRQQLQQLQQRQHQKLRRQQFEQLQPLELQRQQLQERLQRQIQLQRQQLEEQFQRQKRQQLEEQLQYQKLRRQQLEEYENIRHRKRLGSILKRSSLQDAKHQGMRKLVHINPIKQINEQENEASSFCQIY